MTTPTASRPPGTRQDDHPRHGMGVTSGEFQAFVEDVVAVLDEFKVGKAEQDEFLNILAPLRGEIVEVDSSQVGTPLPSAFIPAPAL